MLDGSSILPRSTKIMFEYTKQGYKEAVKFLKETQQYHLVNKELSTDGYTVVALANSIIEHNSDGSDQVSTA
jgi:hypothetical protein